MGKHIIDSLKRFAFAGSARRCQRALWVLLVLTVSPLNAAEIAIIIDDVGRSLPAGQKIMTLPTPVAISLLPDTANATTLAQQAHQQGRPVLIHLPMQSESSHNSEGRQLTLDMKGAQIEAFVEEVFQRLPQAEGLNNHQGSVVTQSADTMRWLMLALGDRYFIDSRTTHLSVAADTARALGVPVRARDVFLDTIEYEQIEQSFADLIEVARMHGSALGIAHPSERTLEALATLLATLPDDVRLVQPKSLLNRPAPPPGAVFALPR